MVKSDTRYRISPQVLSQEVHGETVLLDLQGESYFGLNEVGTRVWQMLKEGRSLDEMLDILEGEFEVSRARLKNDLEDLLGQMLQLGIIEG
jgi:predicted nuclease with TOPRIM domain